MRRPVYTIIFPGAVILALSLICAVQGSETISIKAADKVTDRTNVHYTGKYCDVCHEKKPEPGGEKYLRFNSDFNLLCKCHMYKPGEYTHPVDIIPSEEKRKKIPPDLPLQNGKLSCITCHDISLQCEENPEVQFSNRRFLRGAPFAKRTELCFKCHDDTQYRKLDPHNNQLDENGNIVAAKCLYCHKKKPDELTDSFQEVKLLGDPLTLCQRCHMKSANHPANANHLVMPSLNILSKIKETERQYDVIFPLDYNGKIFCATCHNPHQKGVIPSERIGARVAGSEFGQRFPGKICLACHEK
jgi:hypothetical protein